MVVATLAWTAGAAAAAPPIALGPPIESPTGSPYGPGPGAQTTVVSDLDGDGHLDLVLTDFATTVPRALLGNGDGTFGAPMNLPAATGGVLSIDAGDFNDDGVVDIAGQGEFSIVIWTGNGDGTFAVGQTIWTWGNAQPALVVADVNADGHDDVVAPTPSGLQTYLGNGSTVTAGPRTTAYGVISDLTAANLNGDAHLDLVVVDATPFAQRVRTFRGHGDGRFTEIGSGATGFGPEAAAVADLNGDGIDDVATSDSFSVFGELRFSMTVLISDGSGGFVSRTTHQVGNGPVSGDAGDLNGDGHVDVVISNVIDGTVSLFANDGTGTMVPAGSPAVVSAPQTPVIADVNADGRADLTVPGLGVVAVLLGQ